MHTLTRIRAAACAIMLASVGTLSIPLTADAAGDAAAGEKDLRPLRPLPFDQVG